MSWIMTVEGTTFNFEHPELSTYTIESIAHALSNVCRYAGHCRYFYSVAQHSVYVSFHVPPDQALAALLHDAAEAFIHDISRPLKAMLPDYRVIEKRVEHSIFDHFGVPRELTPEIHHADHVMLATEKRDLMPLTTLWHVPVEILPDPCPIRPWSPDMAKIEFLTRYHDLVRLRT